MSVSDIEEARRRRDERQKLIVETADWAIHNTTVASPWQQDARLLDRCAGFSGPDWTALNNEIERRVAFQLNISATLEDLDAAVQGLSGRYERWTRAANWLERYYPGLGLDHPEFLRHFGDLTPAELALAAVENLRRNMRGTQGK